MPSVRELPVSYRPEAAEDLIRIFMYIQRKSRNLGTAQRFVQRIKDRCDRIGTMPFGGRRRDDLEQGMRIVPFERRGVIAYRIDADQVRIVNIFYGGQDYEALYRSRRGVADE